MKAKKRMLPILAGLLLAVCLEGFHATLAAGSGYLEGDRKLSLSAVQINEYTVSGPLYFPTGGSPWMTFQSEQGVGCLELYFSEPLQSDMDVQLYYSAEEGDEFDRFRAIHSYMMEGTQKARLRLPPGSYKSLRLDIRGGAFSLEKVEAWESVPLRELTAGRLAARIQPFRLIFTALLIIGGLCAESGRNTAGMWRKRWKPGCAQEPEYEEKQGCAQEPEGIEKPGCAERPGLSQKQGRERVLWLDAVRVLATVFVIMVHVLEPLLPLVPQGVMSRMAVGAVLVTLSSNLLFFLLSGALLLPYREESVKTFIENRLMKVALPLLICSYFYIKISCASVVPPDQWITYAVRSLFTGNIKMGPHLWLVYELLGAYLAAVPLRYMLRNMPERTEKQVVCLILFLLGLRTAAAILRESVGFTVFLDGWIGIFLMGYFMTRDWMRKYDKIWVLCGCLALAASVWISGVRADYKDIVCNRSIVMLCMACAVFACALRLERFLQPFKKLLSFLSRHSYTILLVHMFVLYHIIYNGWFSSAMPKLTQVALPLAACCAVSFLLAAAVDHTVLAAAEAAVRGIRTSICNRKR